MRKLFNTHKKKLLAIILLGILIIAVGAFFLSREEVEPEPQKFYSQLTGKDINEEEASRPVLGIMIENSLEARPQTGLNSAGIVFETVTEGGITRYLALYQEDQPETVGPVRSLRPMFVDWVMSFDASVAHVGGSAEALEMVGERGTKSLTQFEYDEPYYRSNDRDAPHNMYVRTEGLRSLQAELGHSESNFSDIPRSEGGSAEEPSADTITVNFSNPNYRTEYRYDQGNNVYIRYLAGEPHIDAATNEPVTVDNLIVIQMDNNSIKATGSGEALLFINGEAQSIQWEMDSFEERLRLVDENDEEVPLNKGKSWFAVLPNNGSFDY